MKEIQLTKGAVAYVSDEDYLDLIKYRWYLSGKYASNSKLGGMHRYLMGLSINKGNGSGAKKNIQQVDHIDGNTLNNCRNNLRLYNGSENQLNHSIVKGRSKYRGVIWCGSMKHLTNAGKYWMSRIKPTGMKRIYLGSFATEEEAAQAYNKAVLKYCPEYGINNKTLNA